VAGVTFSDSDSALVPKFLNPNPGPEFFKFENPTPVQTPATIDPTRHLLMLLWPSRLPKLKSDFGSGSGFHNFLTPEPGSKEKRSLLTESTLELRICGHLWYTCTLQTSGQWNSSASWNSRLTNFSKFPTEWFESETYQAKFMTYEISDLTPCAHARSNILHAKFPDKSDD